MEEIDINYKIIVHGDVDLQEVSDVIFNSKMKLHQDLQKISKDVPITLLTYGPANKLPVATKIKQKLKKLTKGK